MKENFETAYNTIINNISKGTIDTYTAEKTEELKRDLSDTKADAFSTTYTNLENIANNYNAAQFYNQQSRRLSGVLTDVATQSGNNAAILNQNTDLQTRNAEIKDWYFNDKLDTLFVLQLLFITLCLLGFLAFLMKQGYFGMGFFGMLVGVLVVGIILVIANRAIYTEKVRDKRYWSKRGFTSTGNNLPGVNKKCK